MIYDYLLKFGFKANNIGFNYLVDIISLGVKGENLEPMSKVGYNMIADKYGKNIATIDKDIQNSINNAWLYGNRELLYNALRSFGYECVQPDGAFYLFVKSPLSDAKAFCERAKKYELLLVPSDSFGVEGYVRISYCVKRETIERSLPAFEKLIKEFE